jgi:hypothetical protein
LGKEYGKRCEVIGNNMGMHGNYMGTIIKKAIWQSIWDKYKEHMLSTHGNCGNNIMNMWQGVANHMESTQGMPIGNTIHNNEQLK